MWTDNHHHKSGQESQACPRLTLKNITDGPTSLAPFYFTFLPPSSHLIYPSDCVRITTVPQCTHVARRAGWE